MIELLLSLMIQVQTKFKSFCERTLVATDPLPHAEDSPKELVEHYVRTGREDILREINYRVAAGLVSESEIARMTQRALDGDVE